MIFYKLRVIIKGLLKCRNFHINWNIKMIFHKLRLIIKGQSPAQGGVNQFHYFYYMKRYEIRCKELFSKI